MRNIVGRDELMSAANGYWNPICKLGTRLGCRSRFCVDTGHGTTRTTEWETLLLVPVPAYLSGEVSTGLGSMECAWEIRAE